MNVIGENIKKLRKAKGMTQEELKQILGEGDATVEFSLDPWDY